MLYFVLAIIADYYLFIIHVNEMEKVLGPGAEFIRNPLFSDTSIVDYLYYTLFKFIPYDIEINASAFVIPKGEASLVNALEFCRDNQVDFVIEDSRDFRPKKLKDPYGQKVCSFYIVISLANLNTIVSLREI